MDKLELVKLRLVIEGNQKDTLLNALLESARNYILAYTNRTTYLNLFDDIVVKIACIDYNRLGIENLTGQKEGGISNNYIEGYPKDITSVLDRHKVAKIL